MRVHKHWPPHQLSHIPGISDLKQLPPIPDTGRQRTCPTTFIYNLASCVYDPAGFYDAPDCYLMFWDDELIAFPRRWAL